jgi:prepilin-type processing-associated H-X9-DG protein
VRKTRLLNIFIVVGIASLSLVILTTSLSRRRYSPNRVKCHKQLQAIGQAMLLYANEHNGAYPATVDDLIITQDITPSIFVCPASDDVPASNGATLAATAANVAVPGHLSYVILSKGFTDRATPDIVLVYEPLTNHQNTGMHVLFGDSHVEFVQVRKARRIIAELNAGHNPPRPEITGRPAASRPATVPVQ